MADTMEEQWEVIYRTNTQYKADILIALLEENEIPGVIFNKKDSAYLFGEIEVLVSRDHILTAKQIVNQLEANE